jgi:hypothetical protein
LLTSLTGQIVPIEISIRLGQLSSGPSLSGG